MIRLVAGLEVSKETGAFVFKGQGHDVTHPTKPRPSTSTLRKTLAAKRSSAANTQGDHPMEYCS